MNDSQARVVRVLQWEQRIESAVDAGATPPMSARRIWPKIVEARCPSCGCGWIETWSIGFQLHPEGMNPRRDQNRLTCPSCHEAIADYRLDLDDT
jgi:hypothetical protein